MNQDLIGSIRAALLTFGILAVIGCCIVEANMTEPHKEIVSEPATTAEPATRATEPPTSPTIAETTEPTAETEPPTIATEPPTEPPSEPSETWRSLGTFKLTAYCACEKCCGYWATIRPADENGNPIVYTSTGAVAKAGTTIAVDPSIIPYGSTVMINDHTYIAQDTGGSIVGNRVDIYFDNHKDTVEFGVQRAEVFIKTESP